MSGLANSRYYRIKSIRNENSFNVTLTLGFRIVTPRLHHITESKVSEFNAIQNI